MQFLKKFGKKNWDYSVDAHADLRESYEGNPHSHTDVMNLLVNEGHSLASLGVRAICEEERIMTRIVGLDSGTVRIWLGQPHHQFNCTVIFLNLFMSALAWTVLTHPLCLRVGTPVPGGLNYYQAIDLVKSACRSKMCWFGYGRTCSR